MAHAEEVPWLQNSEPGIFRDQPTSCTSKLNPPKRKDVSNFAYFLSRVEGINQTREKMVLRNGESNLKKQAMYRLK
jgi:hypothetical protein